MSDYVELHCHSHYSLLDGASALEELVTRSAELGMPALAITDHNAVYGAPHFSQLAKAAGINPIFGAELTLTGDHHLTLLVENEQGWQNLCHLISLAQHNAPKGQAELNPEALEGRTGGLIALSGCRQGEIAQALLNNNQAAALTVASRYRDLFGPNNFWLELQHHLLPDDERLLGDLVDLATHLGLGYVATNNVHYTHRADKLVQDVLVCIRHLVSLDEAGPLLRDNSEYYLKSCRQLQPLFLAHPEALTNTLHLAERCHFELAFGLQDLPQFPTPSGLDTRTYLQQLCQAAISARYPHPSDRVCTQLEHELAVINQAGLANYFLIVWDIVRYAQAQGILYQGRGSAANSLVAYLLGISPIDPLAHDLVFERFLSKERGVPPDIDLDFQADRREEVIQYVYDHYGHAHAAMACTFVTFRARSAIRDIGKVLGLSEMALHQAAEVLREKETIPALDPNKADAVEMLAYVAQRIHGFPRHVGLHNGGMLVTRSPLPTRLPTEPATMDKRVVVQWDKDGLDDVGLIKIDILGLRMLSAIAEATELIMASTGQDPHLDRLTFDDPNVFSMIASGDTMGVFQVESRAQAQIIPKLKPATFTDLMITISLIRPGPIQGNMVQPFIRRRLGMEAVTYLHPRLEKALAPTLGVILWQEQVLQVATDLAGFSPGQGELLRRTLGRKNSTVEIEKFRTQFLDGAQANDVPGTIAETVFEQLKAFGSYSFAKSHAGSFAVLVYQSAWLKYHYPAIFFVALLNNQPMGFWSPAVLVGDARRHGIAVLPVDIQCSRGKCKVEQGNIRLGFNYVAGFGEAHITLLEQARQARPFANLKDFCRRTRLPRRLVENLIVAGAMAGWGPRRKLLWTLGQLDYREAVLDMELPDNGVELPSLSPAEAMRMEYGVLGLSTGEHVMSQYRTRLAAQDILGSWELESQPNGRQVQVAGLVVVHQSPPTAKDFHFVTLEDEAGLIDLIIRPQVYGRYRRLLRNEPLLVAAGTIQHQDGVTNLLVKRVTSLSLSKN